MKVLHLTSGLLFGGGLERVIVDLMLKNNKTLNYLCVINDQWDEEHIQELDEEFLLLCNRRIGATNPLENFKVIYKIYKFIKQNNINIIHCHNSFALKFAHWIKKIVNINVIFTVHDTNAYYQELNKYHVDQYIAISESVYEVISKYIPIEKIKLIYNGVNLSRFKSSSKTLDVNNIFTISCVARIMPEKKGQDILIRALDIFKKKYGHIRFKCYFAGASYDNKSMNQLNELIKKLQLVDNIEFLGNVEKTEELYANTDVMVLPSRYEGFGLVVVEALAAGCCVVVSKLDGPLEIIKENEEYGLHFEKENYTELAEKLHYLISDKSYYEKYKNNNKTFSYLERNFSLDSMIKGYNEIYMKI